MSQWDHSYSNHHSLLKAWVFKHLIPQLVGPQFGVVMEKCSLAGGRTTLGGRLGGLKASPHSQFALCFVFEIGYMIS